MTPERRVERVRNALWIVGAAAIVGGGLLGWRDSGGLLAAYRLAAFACLAPALGSLIFLLIFQLTGGQWAEGLRRALETGVALLPWIWVLTLPLLWLQPGRFRAPAEATGLLQAYFDHGALVTRSVLYGLVFFGYAFGVRRNRRRGAAPAWFGPAGLIALVFVLHLLSIDWFVALEPGWYSTGFGFVWTTAQAIAGLAAAVAAGLLQGFDPASRGRAGRPLGIDWGNLLLTGVLSWTYVAFVQFLIIWSGNLPREIEWYVHRGYGGWRVVVIVIALAQFAVPFLLLLSRGVKRSAAWLGGIAVGLLGIQVVYTAWLILPAFPAHGLAGLALDGLVTLAALALFWNRYLAGVQRRTEEVAP